MAQLGHMDRETSLDYVHIQQRALQRAKELIEREQAEVLAVARGRVENSVHRIVTPPVLPSAGLRSSIARSRRLSITRRAAYKRRR